MAITVYVLSLRLSPSLLWGWGFCSVKYSKMIYSYLGSIAHFRKNMNSIMLYCGTEQTRIYQSRVCKDNEYHTCGSSLASAAMRVILKIATCVLWNVGHKGESVAVRPGGEILHCVWGLKCIISTSTSLLKYFVWVILTFRAPNRCKIPVLWKMDQMVLGIKSEDCNSPGKQRMWRHILNIQPDLYYA